MKKILYLLIPLSLYSCNWFKDPNPDPQPDVLPEYETTPTIATLPNNIANEASGVCDSRSMPGNVWFQEDGDNPNNIYLFSHQGQYKGSVKMPFPNRDWEDISIGSGPENGKNYLYLADIGDNLAVYDNKYYIYRFIEPQALGQSVTAHDRISFQYPDGSRDAECIMIDPATKDIYIVTKREFNVRLYRLKYPQSVSEIQTAEFLQNIPVQIITSGGISPDGKEIVIRNYEVLYYWYRKDGETIPQTLARTRDKLLPYVRESQGEGFCFDTDGNGYFTNSETPDGQTTPSYLYHFSKKK
ncbi:PE-PGRS family protein [Emticicia agri]|uniref:PE-PGRS family protein n=1 Tax=Emticicia agri TaxID=2492393 RepID=A0A4Q5M0I1_9BACT|nr:PE-PGRS family protein [Emticicia agri]RYU95489.1 PE-PGRS family protein [Emticicia agri]